jgi:AcrR family transcriptional regulator
MYKQRDLVKGNRTGHAGKLMATRTTIEKNGTRKTGRIRRSQEERSATSRAGLLDSAIRLMRERGIAATSMSEIAADANLTRGAIQHHFSSREELILAAVRELDDRLSQAFERYSVPDGVRGIDRVAALFDQVTALTVSPDAIAVYDLLSASRGDPALKDRTLELQRPLTQQFREFWRRNLDGHIPAPLIETSLEITLMMSEGAAMAQLLSQTSDTIGRTMADTRTMLLEFVRVRL